LRIVGSSATFSPMRLADIDAKRGVFENLVCRDFVWHRGTIVEVRESQKDLPMLQIRSDLGQGAMQVGVVSDLLDEAKNFMASGRTCMFKVGEFHRVDAAGGSSLARRVVIEIVSAKKFGGSEPRTRSGPREIKRKLLVESKAANGS
jgi:hypothetical protein